MTDEQWTVRIMAMEQTLYRVSYSLLPERACDREDAVQECIRKVWQKRAGLRDERYMETWAIRVLINECHNLLRGRKREVFPGVLPETAVPPDDADARLHDLFLSLPEKLRLPTVLYYMEDMEVAAIAKLLRLPVGTVKSRLSRARQVLRDEIKHEEAAGHAQ